MDKKHLHRYLQHMLDDDERYVKTAMKRQKVNLRLAEFMDPLIRACEDISRSTGLRLSVMTYSYMAQIDLGRSIRIGFSMNHKYDGYNIHCWIIGHPSDIHMHDGDDNFKYFPMESLEAKEMIRLCLAAGREGWEQPPFSD